MDVPSKWVEQYKEAELKSNLIQIKSDNSSVPDAFFTISHSTVMGAGMSARELGGGMRSTVGDDMDPIEVDGIEGGISYRLSNDCHSVEVLFYTPDDKTQVRITFSYMESARGAWEKYADEFYKSIKLN